MPASGKPVTGKGGTITLTNVTGATPSYSVAADVKDYSYEGVSEIVKGSRLGGQPHKESGDSEKSGKMTIYVAKNDAGVTMPFDDGDHFAFTGTFGSNPVTGTDVIAKRVALPTVERGNFCSIEIEWEATSGGFTATPKVITVA